MEWTFVYLMVALKIPIVALFLIVRWAIKAEPEIDVDDADASDEDGGSKLPRQPIGPRPRSRGPHGDPRLPAPPRARPVRANGQRLADRHHADTHQR